MAGSPILGEQSLYLPGGTTAERPATPTNGMIRYNTTLGLVEQYSGGSWVKIVKGNIGDFAYKEGPVSVAGAYRNNFNNGGHNGTSLDGTTYGDGIWVNESGYYYIIGLLRASGSNNSPSPYTAVGLNGERGLLEGRTDGGWGHDHSDYIGRWSKSVYAGYVPAGYKITCGLPDVSSGYQALLAFGTAGHNGGIIVWRIN